jgi:hypothetical protein
VFCFCFQGTTAQQAQRPKKSVEGSCGIEVRSRPVRTDWKKKTPLTKKRKKRKIREPKISGNTNGKQTQKKHKVILTPP